MNALSCFVAGRLGKDPEMRYTSTGTPVCNLDVAVNRYMGKEKGNVTFWYKATFWGPKAEVVNNHFKSGQVIGLDVERIHSEAWLGSDGDVKSKVVLTCRNFEFGGGKKDSDEAVDDALPF